MGLRGLWTHSADRTQLRRYVAGLPGLQYLLPDYGRLPTTAPDKERSADGSPPHVNPGSGALAETRRKRGQHGNDRVREIHASRCHGLVAA